MSSFSINQVILAGNVIKNAELKFTKNQTPVLKFGIATNESVKKGDEWVNMPTFHDVIVWGKLGELVASKLVKGVAVTVSGKISKRSWEYEGKKHYATEVVADKVVVSAQPQRQERQVTREDAEQALGQPQEQTYSAEAQSVADDIPF